MSSEVSERQIINTSASSKVMYITEMIAATDLSVHLKVIPSMT